VIFEPFPLSVRKFSLLRPYLEKVFSKHGSFTFLIFDCSQTSILKLFSKHDTEKRGFCLATVKLWFNNGF